MAEPGIAYLSIGEVLGLLLVEFPDVTISKIRFLESQGLIEPERTPSGYRKFLEHDVERLRVILREQSQNFLPLRVIKDRLESGEIESSCAGTPPRGSSTPAAFRSDHDDHEAGLPSAAVVAGHPAARHAAVNRVGGRAGNGTPPEAVAARTAAHPDAPGDVAARGRSSGPGLGGSSMPSGSATSPRLLPGVVVNREELCAMASVSREQLAALEEYGVIAKRARDTDLYGEDAVEIAAAAGGFLRAGVDARHLRAWRTSVEREVGLYEQLVVPLLRQRNPESRSQAVAQLDELHGLGNSLRNALMRATVRQQFQL